MKFHAILIKLSGFLWSKCCHCIVKWQEFSVRWHFYVRGDDVSAFKSNMNRFAIACQNISNIPHCKAYTFLRINIQLNTLCIHKRCLTAVVFWCAQFNMYIFCRLTFGILSYMRTAATCNHNIATEFMVIIWYGIQPRWLYDQQKAQVFDESLNTRIVHCGYDAVCQRGLALYTVNQYYMSGIHS